MAGERGGLGITRRQFLGAGAAAAVGGAAALTAPRARALGRLGRPRTKRRVAIFGAGVAGLSAAHELAERGFEVTVYERDHLGGKAWSLGVPGSAASGRPALPGEHGFRFFPGFYKNLGDTMRRTPMPDGGVAYDRLVRASTYRSSWAGRADATIPLSWPPMGVTQDAFQQSVEAALVEAGLLPAHEAAYFASKLWVYVTSCDERRLGQWDYLSWKDFIREDQMSEEYRKVVSRSLVRNLAATKSDEASTHAIGLVGEALILSLVGRGNDVNASPDRVLDGPTSQAWLDGWIAHLRSLGVRFAVGMTLARLQVKDGRIGGAELVDRRGAPTTVKADWYISAVPVERAARLLTGDVLDADPRLAGVARLKTDWMSGLQFYLREALPLTHGHVNYVDSPFALTSISQAQFWKDDMAGYGDGTVRESFSTIISDWVTPGIVFGKIAKDCTPPELAREVWEQIKVHLNDHGEAVLRDEMLHSWFLDPAIVPVSGPGPQRVDNDTPLFIQDPGEWANRPESVTAVPNLFLAGDWVRTPINVTTMEGANTGGRLAANGVLDASDSAGERAQIWHLEKPAEYEPLKALDQQRYRLGLPNQFDPDQDAP